MTLLEKANRYPPRIVRLLAAPATTRELAVRSGIPRSTVHQISCKDNWDSVPLGLIERFTTACGVNLLAHKRHRQNLKNRLRGMSNLARRVKPTQRKLLQRLLA
jgi:hypothetical protein